MLESIGKQVIIRSSGASTTGKKVVKVELTGSPKSAGFKTKELFLEELNKKSQFEYQLTDLKSADMLVTDDLSSSTSKMSFAKTKGIRVKTYLDLFDQE